MACRANGKKVKSKNPLKLVNENHVLCQFYLRFPFRFHENTGLILPAFSSLPQQPCSGCGNEESPWKQQDFTLEQMSDFAYNGIFAYLSVRKMFKERFGSFSYQIKPIKFYQFLELSQRIVLLLSEGKKTPTTQPKTQQVKPKRITKP